MKNADFIPVDFNPFEDTVGNFLSLPTTTPQQEIFSNIIIGGHEANCSYNESVSLILTGSFNFLHFKTAVQQLIARHEALRSRFSPDGLIVFITSELTIEVSLIDLSLYNGDEQKTQLDRLIQGEVNKEFDIYNGPLIRVSVVKLSENKHQVILTLHHIIGDGWSIGICMIDLSRLYSALCTGTDHGLPTPNSWNDFTKAETEYLNSTEYQQTLRFWINEFKDGIPPVELPINHPRPALRTYKANRLDIPLEPETIRHLRAIGAKAGCSFVNTMIAAFEIYIHRLISSDDVILQLPTAGQSVSGFENLVGHCVNVIPIRSKIKGNLNFTEYLKERKRTLLAQLENQRITLGDLVRELKTERDPSKVPFSPVAFNLDMGMTNGVDFHGLELKFITNPRAYENSEWFINCAGNGDEILLECTYNAGLFDEEMMQLRMKEFITVLKSIASNPDQALKFLEILPAEELNKVIVEWNSNFVDLPVNKTINSLFEEQVLRTPDAEALWHQTGTLSYAELNRQANQLSHYLISKGFKPGMLCAVAFDRTPELVVALYAILKSGGAYIPMTPDYPADRIAFIMQESGCNFIVTQSDQKEKIISLPAEKIILNEEKQNIRQQSESNPGIEDDEFRLAYVIYTSGSTGKPKGVAIMHHSVISFFQWAKNLYTKEEISGVLGSTSVTFDPSVFEFFFTLTHGGRLVLVNNAIEMAYLPSSAQVSMLSSVPSAASELLKMPGGFPLTMKTILLGGELLTTELVNDLYDKTPAKKVYDLYGPTEDTYCSTWNLRLKNDKPTIGRPLPNTQAYILDKNLQPVPIGIAGELHLGGDGLAKGYFNRPDLTAERFIPNPFSIEEGARLYKTGDLCRYKLDGRIEFLGRLDFQVKVRGFRIELQEIENVLRNHPLVNDLLVTVFKDEKGDQQLVVYLTLKNKSENIIDELRNHLKQSVPDYMIPQVFMILDQMPLNANGKIDRKALPPPVIAADTSNDDMSFVQLSITEEKLKDIWKTILNHDRFGINDNFFTIGGHSLLGVRMFIELEKQLGVKLPLQTLFKSPTIKELAAVIDNEESNLEWKPVVMFRNGGNKPPLFCLHMHNGNIYRWKVLEKYLPEDQPIYAIQPKALDPNQTPHRNIAEQAAYYIEEIKKIQPHGPYHFVGLCYGGTTAYEMALQLEASGEKTALLFMVNNYAPLENQKLYRMTKGFERFFKMDFSEKLNYALEKNLNLGRKIKDKALGIFTKKIAGPEHPAGEKHEDIRVIHTLALMAYQPVRKYNGDVFIVRAGGPVEDPEFYDETIGWKKWVNGKIEVVQVEGSNNDTIIEEEQYHSQLAAFLKRKLEEVQLSDSITTLK